MYKEKITQMIINATKEHNKAKENIYKELKTEFINYQTSKNAKPLNDAAEINIIQKTKKKLDEAIPLFIQQQREELALEYKSQSKYLKDLLPKAPTKNEIGEYIIINYPEGIEKKQMGKVIKEIKTKFLGANGKMVADLVKAQLK